MQPRHPLATMKRIVPDETLLFHYSSLGFNSHRIHLDRDFARQAEGFPDLVVNGGLATLLLTELLRNEPGGVLTSLAAKHVAPLFCGRPIFLGADRQGDKWLLRAFDDFRPPGCGDPGRCIDGKSHMIACQKSSLLQ